MAAFDQSFECPEDLLSSVFETSQQVSKEQLWMWILGETDLVWQAAVVALGRALKNHWPTRVSPELQVS